MQKTKKAIKILLYDIRKHRVPKEKLTTGGAALGNRDDK